MLEHEVYRFSGFGLAMGLLLALLVTYLFGATVLEAHESVVKEQIADQEPAAVAFLGSEAMFVAPHIRLQAGTHQTHEEREATPLRSPAGSMDHDHAGMDMAMDMDMAETGHEHSAGEPMHHHAGGTPAAALVWALLGASLTIAGLLLFSARRSLRAGTPLVNMVSTNILALPVIGKFLRSRYFLALIIAPTLLIFSFIVIAGLMGEQSTANPAVLLTWILWWPAVIFTFFLLGRIWCAVCPFGYLGDLAQKIFSFHWKVPAILRNMWWRLGLFLALTWATTLWTLDRWPRGTAWLALSLTLGAITLAVVFEKRAFCRYVCPVGGVFGLYSMTAPLRLGVKDHNVCQQECTQKNCYQACAWFQFPATLNRNAECSLCLDCVRACPHDNLTLQTQPFGADLAAFQPHRKSLDEALAISVVLGVGLLQTIVMLNVWSDWQSKIGGFLGIEPGRLLYTIIFVSIGVILPTLLFLLVSYFTLPKDHLHGDFLRALRTYAYAFLPLGLALHAAHNFHHLFGEGGAMWSGLKEAVARYTGWAALASHQQAAAPPGPNTLFIMQWAALMAGLYLAFRVGVALVRRNTAQPERAFRNAIPILLFATAFTVLNLVVLSAAMGHRH